jgi:3',5'-cyclic AMP phosphodiesterase CpdA
MIAGSAEKSEIRQIIEKFNVNIKQDRIFVVDLEYYCTTIVKQKLYELASCCMQDRILEKLNTKILFIENLLNNSDKLDNDYNSPFRLSETIVFD